MKRNRKAYQLIGFLIFIATFATHSFSKVIENQTKLNNFSDDIASRSRMIDANNIAMWVLPNGLFANDPATGYSGLEFPRGSGNMAIYTAGLILGAMLEDSLHIMLNYYSSDCTPGAIGADGISYGKEDPAFRVYKISKEDLHQPGLDYLQWPVEQGAPVDSLGNPFLIGDQTLWCCFTDGYGQTSYSSWFRTAPLGAEIHMSVFAWEEIENTVFIFWEIINKSNSVWDSTFVGIVCDPDLGEATDDMVGSDSLLSLAYCYNGDAHDPYYGYEPPAIGFAFIQTPIVPSFEDTSLVFGQLILDHRSLPARAPLIFKHGIPYGTDRIWGEKFHDAKGKKYAYLRMQGLNEISQPMLDPITGKVTQWAFPGDPILGNGWVFPWSPQDCHFFLSSGPFKMAPGDTQVVGIAVVVGQGNDYLNSIVDLKQRTLGIRSLYENDFPIMDKFPSPVAKVGQFDGEIVLSWDTRAVSYASRSLGNLPFLGRYEFEGYNVYQGETQQGPWHRVAVFDQNNGVKTIMDYRYSEELGYSTEIKVAEGRDSGVRHYVVLEKDWQGERLVNGRRYYFAVTAYAYNPKMRGFPKVLETEKTPILAIPQFPLLNTQYNADIGDAIEVIHHGASDAQCQVKVLDPSKLTGHAYQVEFYSSGREPFEVWYWKLTDITSSVEMLTDQSNLSGDEAYPVLDGFQVKVFIPTIEYYGINYKKGMYSSYGIGYGGFSYEGSLYITGVDWGGVSFFYGMDIGEKLYGTTLGALDYVDVRIDFANSNWSKAYVYRRDEEFQFEGLGDFPGAAYDVEDPDNPRRLNICFLEDGRDSVGIADLRWDPVACSQASLPKGGYEVLFIMQSEYDPSGATYPADAEPFVNDGRWGPGADVLYVIWAEQRGSHQSHEEFSMYIYCNHPITADNSFTFSTVAPAVSDEITKSRINEINVFPNPYFGYNRAETSLYRHFVTFSHLPPKCTIRIFSLSGQLVKTILHTDGTGFEQWDLSNDASPKMPVASGIYIAHIEIPNVGHRLLKLALVMPQESFILYE